MGNVSPRQSKSYHDELSNHLSLSSTTPNRSSWKKQLQIINDTLHIRKISLRHINGKAKRYRTKFDKNNHDKLSTSLTTQNFHDLAKNHCEKLHNENYVNTKKIQQENHEQQINIKKSFSLFLIKPPLTDSTNQQIITKSINNTTNTITESKEDRQKTLLNSRMKTSDNIVSYQQPKPSFMQEKQTTDVFDQYKRQHKFEIRTGEYVSNATLHFIPLFHRLIIYHLLWPIIFCFCIFFI